MGAEDPKRLIGTPAATTSATPSAPPPLPQQYAYKTFQGVACYSQPPSGQPVVGFPQPAPPPVATASPYHYPVGYQSVHGYVVADGRPFREERLPCCGIGIGWPLFIAGFFFASIPWYVGAIILLCGRVDYREKPGLVACMIATILAVIAIVFGVTGGVESW